MSFHSKAVGSFNGPVKNGDEVGWNYVSFRDDNIRVDHKWRDGEKVYSLSKDVERFNGYIDAYAVNNLEEHTPLEVVSEMPQVYNRIFSKFPEYHLAQGGIRIFSSVLDKATGKKKSNYSGDYHNVSLDALRKLPYNLHNPVMVLKGNRANSIEILTMIKDESGRSVMAVIQLDEEERHNVINRISTVFGKDSAQYFLNKLESGKGLYVNKKRADDWSLSAKVQSLGEVLLKARSFGTIIDENDSVKFSITSSVERTPDLVALHNLTARKVLEDNGVRTYEYRSGDRGDRVRAVNRAADEIGGLRFSISSSEQPERSGDAEADGAFRSGFYTPTEERSIPRMLMPFLLEHPDADALMVRDHLEGEGVRVARDEDAERFLLAFLGSRSCAIFCEFHLKRGEFLIQFSL